jgi:tmRNA-binding protein
MDFYKYAAFLLLSALALFFLDCFYPTHRLISSEQCFVPSNSQKRRLILQKNKINKLRRKKRQSFQSFHIFDF